MGSSRRFTLRLGLRIAGLVAATLAFAWLVQRPGLPTATLLAAACILWAGVAIWSLVQRTNIELARFIGAIGQRDLTQSHAQGGRGSGFDELGRAFEAAIARLRDGQAKGRADTHFAELVVDSAPTPILAIDAQGRIDLANRAARRLFAGVRGVRTDDYAAFGAPFVEALRHAESGRRLTQLTIDGVQQRAMLGVTAIDRNAERWRVVVLQVIQHELDLAEVAAQAELVRILTHEIMNSMTPVTSLAVSAAELMAGIDVQDAAFADARAAVETLARRADGIMHFVDTYRAFTAAPLIAPVPIAARAWAAQLATLFAASPHGAAVRLELAVEPGEPVIMGDAALLTQVMLNLLKNAGEAALGHAANPVVTLSIASVEGGRMRLAVADNGPGIAPRHANEIFLPFFTTKRDGTGVGLSLARQIVLLHGGSIRVAPHETGACIEIML